MVVRIYHVLWGWWWSTAFFFHGRWKSLSRGKKWAVSWLTGIVLSLLIVAPWPVIGVVAIIIGFVAFIIATMVSLFALFDP